MVSFLIVSKNHKKHEEYLSDFARKNEIYGFDQTIIYSENSVGIQIVRDLQKSAYLKPFKSKEKLIAINNAEKLTIEAQNALLKIIEEPPQNTYIFLFSSTILGILPTIISRCKVIEFGEEKKSLSQEDKKNISENLKIILSNKISDKIYLAEKISSDKDTVCEWFENVFFYLHEDLIKSPGLKLASIIETIQKSYTIFQTTNVNTRLLLEHTFLEL